MADIVLADLGESFTGRSLTERPLGGAEGAYILLAEAFARRGHRVTAFSRCTAPEEHNGVSWRPLETSLPTTADLYIANRSHALILQVPRARHTVFWLHNPAGYILKWRYLWKLAWRRPVLAFLGPYHASTCPLWVPSGGRLVLPYGVNPLFAAAPPLAEVPGPQAIFLSNPQRGLDWLLEVWRDAIVPRVPQARLLIFSGKATYGSFGEAKAKAMQAVLDQAAGLADHGVVLRDPLPKPALLDELQRARVLLYRGDPGETYCLAVGESQTLGVPAVVQAIGSTAERVIPGETGFVARDAADFADKAVALLTDDALWRRQHEAALARQRRWTWDDVAARYEALFPALRPRR